jgi:CheY-like chemotaxis protein
MARELGGCHIDDVLVVDDNERARDSAAMTIADASLRPVKQADRLPELHEFVELASAKADAVFCDHHLNVGQYARFYGAEAVAELYKKCLPAVLCTRFTRSDMDHIRPFLRFIPALITPDSLEPEAVAEGFERCVEEFKGAFRPFRKPWRTVVRIENVEQRLGGVALLDVFVPAWNSQEGFRIPADVFRTLSLDQLKPGFRFHARVNLGAESWEQLFFDPAA